MTQDQEPDSPDYRGWLNGLPEALGIIALLIHIPLIVFTVHMTAVLLNFFLYPQPDLPGSYYGLGPFIVLFVIGITAFSWILTSLVLVGIFYAFRKYKRFIRWLMAIQAGIILLVILLDLIYVAYVVSSL